MQKFSLFLTFLLFALYMTPEHRTHNYGMSEMFQSKLKSFSTGNIPQNQRIWQATRLPASCHYIIYWLLIMLAWLYSHVHTWVCMVVFNTGHHANQKTLDRTACMCQGLSYALLLYIILIFNSDSFVNSSLKWTSIIIYMIKQCIRVYRGIL